MKKSHFLHSLQKLHHLSKTKDLSLGEILSILGEDGHFIMMAFLTLPFLQPIPFPGLSSILGGLIFLISIFMILGKPPWIPNRYRGYTMSHDKLMSLLMAAEKIWRKIERVIHQRWEYLYQGAMLRQVNFFIIVLNAVLLSLPVPIPLTNTLPAFSILFNSLGQIEKDGLLILLSYLVSLVSVVYFLMIAFGLQQGFNYFQF